MVQDSGNVPLPVVPYVWNYRYCRRDWPHRCIFDQKFNLKDTQGEQIIFHDKDKSWARYLIGGSIFGLGWALTGACPGVFVNIGYGYWAMGIVVLGALMGTYLYGVIKHKLPH